MSQHRGGRGIHRGASVFLTLALAYLACGAPTLPPGPRATPAPSWAAPEGVAPAASEPASASASALPPSDKDPSREEPPKKTKRSLPEKGSVLCEGTDLLGIDKEGFLFVDTCPSATELCCSHAWGAAACLPRSKGCPDAFVPRQCDSSDDCPRGTTCQAYQKNHSDFFQVCSAHPLGKERCFNPGICSVPKEICTQGRNCSRKDHRCVVNPAGDLWLCEPIRPPLPCGDEVCQTPGAPICIAAPGKPRRCGSYQEGWTDRMECFRDGDCEKGAVCCVNSAQMSMCERQCDPGDHSAICGEQADCDRYFKKHEAELRPRGISGMLCESVPWRGISTCSPKK